MVQYNTASEIALPDFQLVGNLNTKYSFFKSRLQGRVGVDYYLSPSFDLPSFNPIHGGFYDDRSRSKSDLIVLLNPYLQIDIDKFHFYLKMTNPLGQLRGVNYYLTKDYPLYDYRIAFGVRWTLLD